MDIEGIAMERTESPHETEPIEYDAPCVLEVVDVEAQLAVISG
jgi:hypothetical protein